MSKVNNIYFGERELLQHNVSNSASGLDAVGLGKSYGEFEALRNVNINVAPGEFLTLLGPSGSGKTTFLMAIAGFITPTSGRLLENNIDITYLAPNKRNFGMVFQGYALFPHLTALENVMYPLRVRKLPFAERCRQATEMLERVELAGHVHKRPSALSGGQQQRVALARALVYRPPVLLLDEPFSALDKGLRAGLQSELRSIHNDLGTTFVFVTHDQTEALALSDRIAIFEKGVLRQIDSPREIYRHPKSRFAAEFLGRINLLPVSAVRVVNGLATGQHAETMLHCPSDRPDAESEDAIIAVRPEYLRVGTPSDAENGLVITVQNVIYAGASFCIEGRTDAGSAILLDIADCTSYPSKGDRVCVCWSAHDGYLLPAESDQ